MINSCDNRPVFVPALSRVELKLLSAHRISGWARLVYSCSRICAVGFLSTLMLLAQDPSVSSLVSNSESQANLPPQPLPSNQNDINFKSASGFEFVLESDPIMLNSIQATTDYAQVRWLGGLPPYRVEMSPGINSAWTEVTWLIMDNYYAGPTSYPLGFYRVKSVPDTNAPTVPSELRLEALLCERLVIAWQPANDGPLGSGLKTYRLRRDGELVRQIVAPEIFSLDTNLQPFTTYRYTVSAIDRSGNESRPSEPLTVTTPQCPTPGTNGVGSNPGVTLAWDPNEDPNIAGYIVHWGLAPGNYSWQIDVMQATTAFIADLESGVPFFFAITAYDNQGVESEPSDKVTFIPP